MNNIISQGFFNATANVSSTVMAGVYHLDLVISPVNDWMTLQIRTGGGTILRNIRVKNTGNGNHYRIDLLMRNNDSIDMSIAEAGTNLDAFKSLINYTIKGFLSVVPPL